MKTRRRLRRGGVRPVQATVLALLPLVANGESLWSSLLSGKRLTDKEVSAAATEIVTKASELHIPLPPTPLTMIQTVLKTWTPPPTAEEGAVPALPSSIDPAGVNPATANWLPGKKVTVHSTNREELDETGFETTPVTVVSDDGRMVYVRGSDDDLDYPFPKSQIELRPVGGGRRRRTARRRKTLRRKM